MFDKKEWSKQQSLKPEFRQKSREASQRYRAAHLEKCREQSREWRKNHPEQKAGLAIESKWRNREQHYLAKIKAILHYSNPKGYCICNACGEQDIVVLCLDHIKGDGGKQRKETGISGSRFYTWLEQQGYPEGLQVLCWNCNHKKELYRY